MWHDYPDNVEYGLRLASAQKSSGKAKDSLATVEMLRALPVPGRDDPRIDLAEASADFALGNLKPSQEAATKAAEKSQSLGSSNILAKAKTAQAKVIFEQQDYPAALILFRQSLDIYQQVGDAIGVTTSLCNIASVLQTQGQLPESLGMYEKALAIYLKDGDKTSAALTLNNIGAVYETQRNFSEARKAYGKSLDLYRELGDKLNQGFVLNNLAQVLFLDGDLRAARKMHENALALDRENANQVATAEALFDLSQVSAAQGDLAGARKSLEEALKIWTDVGAADSANSARLALSQVSLEDGQSAGRGEPPRASFPLTPSTKSKVNSRPSLRSFWRRLCCRKTNYPKPRLQRLSLNRRPQKSATRNPSSVSRFHRLASRDSRARPTYSRRPCKLCNSASIRRPRAAF